MVLKTKTFPCGKKTCKVELVKNTYNFTVLVDGEIYKETPNELFAVHAFNKI